MIITKKNNHNTSIFNYQTNRKIKHFSSMALIAWMGAIVSIGAIPSVYLHIIQQKKQNTDVANSRFKSLPSRGPYGLSPTIEEVDHVIPDFKKDRFKNFSNINRKFISKQPVNPHQYQIKNNTTITKFTQKIKTDQVNVTNSNSFLKYYFHSLHKTNEPETAYDSFYAGIIAITGLYDYFNFVVERNLNKLISYLGYDNVIATDKNGNKGQIKEFGISAKNIWFYLPTTITEKTPIQFGFDIKFNLSFTAKTVIGADVNGKVSLSIQTTNSSVFLPLTPDSQEINLLNLRVSLFSEFTGALSEAPKNVAVFTNLQGPFGLKQPVPKNLSASHNRYNWNTSDPSRENEPEQIDPFSFANPLFSLLTDGDYKKRTIDETGSWMFNILLNYFLLSYDLKV